VQAVASPIEARVRAALQRRRVGFREQWPIGPYRADFYLPAHRLVIEADGAAWHTSPARRRGDGRRDRYMRARGYRVIRLTGREIYRDADAAVGRALRALAPVRRTSRLTPTDTRRARRAEGEI